MWHTIFNWPWATIWAAVSAIFTAAAVGVAAWAIFRWRKQEELRVKLDFKKAITEYSYVLSQMPESLKHVPALEQAAELKRVFGKCTFEWMACEGLLGSNQRVSTNWTSLVINHSQYLAGDTDAYVLMTHCLEIMQEKFVFD